MNNRLYEKILLMSLCFTFASANVPEDLSIKKLGSDGKRTYEDNKVINYNETTSDLGKFNYSEVVYEHLKAYQYYRDKETTSPARLVSASYDFYKDKTDKVKFEQEETERLKNEFEKMQKESQIVFLQGYCHLPNEITIERIAGYSVARCDFLDVGQGTLAMSITPDFFSQALVGTPLYVTLSNNQKYSVKNGVVLNGAKTSINIASSVNDRLIQKIVAGVGITTSTIATKYAQQYLDERKESRTQETSGEIIINNGTTIQQGGEKIHQAPPKSDYIAGAVVELVSSLASLMGNAYIDTIPYTFKINRNTILYTDLKIDLNERNIRGINFAPKNMIQNDEPRFDKETFEFIHRDNTKEVYLDGYEQDKSNAKEIPLGKPIKDDNRIR